MKNSKGTFKFIHSHPFWEHWLKPGRAKTRRSGDYYDVANPDVTIIVNDKEDRSRVELADQPSTATLSAERRFVKFGEKSVWLEEDTGGSA